jgi:hypothetical protein
MLQLRARSRIRGRSVPAHLGRLLALPVLTIGLSLASSRPAEAQTFKKVIDRAFPVFFYCPIDPALTLTFTASGSQAILSFSADNYSGTQWAGHVVDNVAIVPQSVFNANQVLSPGYETCYSAPGSPNTKGYDFINGSPEAYLNLFDAGANGWDLGTLGYYNNFNSAPRNPTTGGDLTGGGLGLGEVDDPHTRVTVSTLVSGLVPGTTYVVTGWWYAQVLAPIEIGIDFSLPKTLSIAGTSFTAYDSTTDFPDHSAGVLTGSSNFVAPLPLRHGAQLLELSLVGQVIAPFEAITAQIRRVDNSFYGAGNPQTVATVTLSDFTPSSIETRTVAIPAIAIDLDHSSYYVNIQQGGGGVLHGVRIRYKDPDPAGTQSIAIAGLGFDAERTGTDVKWGNVGVMLNGTPGGAIGRYVAPVRLPQGASVTSFSVIAFDEVSDSATVRLLRVPVTVPIAQVMAAVTTTGTSGDPVRPYSTSTISPPLIDNAANYYYVDISMGHVLDIYGVRIFFTLPGSSPSTVSDAIAAVPFLPEQPSDQRQPFQGTLQGSYRFNTGLQLPDGAQVLSLSMTALDNSDDGDLTAFLYRSDAQSSGVGALLMATLTSRGSADGPRTFTTDLITQGRVIDNAHNFYYVQLWTGFAPVSALGVTVNTAPCGDHDGDGFDGCVNDCNANGPATRPGAPEVCDGQVNNCSASFWPDPTGTVEGDDDFDGFSECQGDCNDADASRWSPPSEPQNLMLSHNLGTGVTTLNWSAPLDAGSTTSPVYDTLRATSPNGFGTASAVCVESNGADLASTQTGAGPVGSVFYFLIRAEGVCGAGLLGHTSNGTAISGRNCP